MSRFDAFTKGWSFRTSTPNFEPGEEIVAFVTGRENGSHIARIGDTILHLNGANDSEDGDRNQTLGGDGVENGTDLLDSQVRLRIKDFNTNNHTGRAVVLENIGQSSF